MEVAWVSSAETEREASKNGNGKRREVDPGTPEAKLILVGTVQPHESV